MREPVRSVPRRLLNYNGGAGSVPTGLIRRRMVTVKWKIALYPSEEGFAVSVPSLPGCWSQGGTREEALANIAEAIRDYLGAEIDPEPGAEIEEVEVSV
jgi:predicted RNase H-like HicB family nuclease